MTSTSVAILVVPAAVFEGKQVLSYIGNAGRSIYYILLGNALVAAVLNPSALNLLRKTTALTASLSGILKDCIAVIGAHLIAQMHPTILAASGWLTSIACISAYALIRAKQTKPR